MSLKKVEFYIPVFLILLMVYRNSWITGGEGLYGKEVYLVCISAFSLILINFDFKKVLNFNFQLLTRNYFSILLFFTFAISVFFFNSQEITVTVNLIRLVAFFCYIYIYFYFFAGLLHNDELLLHKFLTTIYYVGIFISLTGLVFLYTGYNPLGLYIGMFISFSIHPNYIASLLLYSIFTSIYIYFRISDQKFTSKKAIVLFFIVLQVYSLISTISRATVLGLAVGLIVYSFYIFKKKYLFVIYPIALAVLPPYLILFTESKGISSFLSRFLLLVPAYYMVNESNSRLLFGYGATNAFPEYEKAKLFYNMFVEENVNNPHNMYVSLILMFGLIFTILFLVMIAYLFYKSIKKAGNASRSERLYIGYIIATLSALLAQGIFESQIVQPEYYSIQIFLLFLGLLYKYISNFNKTFKFGVSAGS